MKFRGRVGRDRNQNLAAADLEHAFRDVDDKFDSLDTDAIATFSTDYTVKPHDRCLVFRDARAAAKVTFPSVTAWGAKRSALVRIANRTGFTLTLVYPTSSFTIAAGLNCLAWTDGFVINGIVA